MFRKLPTVLPLAILLGAIFAAPALAQTRSHNVVQTHRHVTVSPSAFGGDAYARAEGAYAFVPPSNENTMACPTLEGYPDCH